MLPREGWDHNPYSIIATGTLEEDRRKREKVIFTLPWEPPPSEKDRSRCSVLRRMMQAEYFIKAGCKLTFTK